MSQKFAAAADSVGAGSAGPAATEINLLSAGAVEPGLIDAVAAFRKESGHEVRITWATTPTIRKRIAEGDLADVLVVPLAAVEDFAREGKVAGKERVYIGRVGIGIAVREGAPLPDITSVEALKQSLLDAESVVHTTATSGLYVEELLRKMGIHDRIKAKITRFATGPAMMEHLINGKGRGFGFGATIEILMFRDAGLRLAGPLPPEVQHYTTYLAVPMTAAPNAAGAQAFIRYLATPAAKAVFAAYGIE